MSDSVATVYAQALFDAAKQQNAVDGIWEELTCLATLWKEDDVLALFMKNPSVEKQDKQALVDKVFQDLEQELVRNFLGVLIHKDRVGHLAVIADAFRDLMNVEAGVLHARVRSAVALTEQSKTDLAARLSSRFGGTVEIQEEVDSELLGGLIVQVGDTVIDGSVKQNIKKVARAMAQVEASEKVWENNNEN